MRLLGLVEAAGNALELDALRLEVARVLPLDLLPFARVKVRDDDGHGRAHG